MNVGLSLGAFGWGFGSDKIGRRLGFNSTLIIAGIFAFMTGIAPNFIAEAAFLGVLGLGVGGSLPVDGTMFVCRSSQRGVPPQARDVAFVRYSIVLLADDLVA